MQSLTLRELCELSNGKLNNDSFGDLVFSNISNDSREIELTEVYLPLKGEKFDGHQFIDQVVQKNVVAVISEFGKYSNENFPVIYVENTNESYQTISKNYRDKFDVKIVSLTGSNGKTTTKDLISSVLKKKFNTLKTLGNLNNEIGVPRTLLRIDSTTQAAVVEMGTDGFGQIEVLSNLSKPDVAIITNIGDAHLHQLLTKENVAKEKLHIIDGLKPNGYFIFNNDDDILRNEVSKLNISQKVISFGQRDDSTYKIDILESNNQGSKFSINGETFSIPLIGTHQIYNSAVAIIVGHIYGISNTEIEKALFVQDITKMRSEIQRMNGFDILNDAYKSNPQSLRTALNTFEILSGYSKKIAIIGDMLELGDTEESLHKEISDDLSPSILDTLILYGPLSKHTYEESSKKFDSDKIFWFEDKSLLIEKVKNILEKNSLVLVKASRGMRLEEVIEGLQDLEL